MFFNLTYNVTGQTVATPRDCIRLLTERFGNTVFRDLIAHDVQSEISDDVSTRYSSYHQISEIAEVYQKYTMHDLINGKMELDYPLAKLALNPLKNSETFSPNVSVFLADKTQTLDYFTKPLSSIQVKDIIKSVTKSDNAEYHIKKYPDLVKLKDPIVPLLSHTSWLGRDESTCNFEMLCYELVGNTDGYNYNKKRIKVEPIWIGEGRNQFQQYFFDCEDNLYLGTFSVVEPRKENANVFSHFIQKNVEYLDNIDGKPVTFKDIAEMKCNDVNILLFTVDSLFDFSVSTSKELYPEIEGKHLFLTNSGGSTTIRSLRNNFNVKANPASITITKKTRDLLSNSVRSDIERHLRSFVQEIKNKLVNQKDDIINPVIREVIETGFDAISTNTYWWWVKSPLGNVSPNFETAFNLIFVSKLLDLDYSLPTIASFYNQNSHCTYSSRTFGLSKNGFLNEVSQIVTDEYLFEGNSSKTLFDLNINKYILFNLIENATSKYRMVDNSRNTKLPVKIAKTVIEMITEGE